MNRKTYSIVATGLLTLASAVASTRAITLTQPPALSPVANPSPAVLPAGVAMCGPFQTPESAVQAGEFQLQHGATSYAIEHRESAPEGFSQAVGYFCIVQSN